MMNVESISVKSNFHCPICKVGHIEAYRIFVWESRSDPRTKYGPRSIHEHALFNPKTESPLEKKNREELKRQDKVARISFRCDNGASCGLEFGLVPGLPEQKEERDRWIDEIISRYKL